jgi:hypothetical protein
MPEVREEDPVTFPNGRFGRRWILGLYLFGTSEGLLAGLLSVFITNPIFVLFNNIWGAISFPLILFYSV